ncbi:hypothetical protein GCM10011452_38060 [Gemmobacter lanyuensis]|uniref:Glycosyltransferase subfamily 4-like N-terminal domain-containing protein n=2 Tax=Gemmobacter lanyuensis TaxID=1054497 RepID=A0A918J6A1_9RHOB|nr:hypothetical protein GCM10011452_38060 [Gemmobacter lanyuensis]
MPYPPAIAGDAVYSRGIIEALSLRANVTVLCADSGAVLPADSRIEWHVTGPQRKGRKGSVLSRWPLLAWKGAQPDYHKRLDVLLARKWDAIIVDNLGTVHAMPKLEAYRRLHPACVLVHFSHEHEYATRSKKYGAYPLSIVGRLATWLDLAKIWQSETRLLRNCNLVTVLNEEDERRYREVAPEQRYLMQTPGYDGRISPSRIISAKTPRRVLLLGGRRSEQKQQVLLDWLRASHAILARAGIETQVVGDMPDSLRRQLATDYPTLDVRGFVDDPSDLVLAARAGLIVDTLGGGFKLRLLSHVFERLPIIGLAEAIEGLPTAAGKGYLAAADHTALAHLLVDTIDDFDRLNDIMNTAFADCSGRFSWDSRATALIAALGGGGAASPQTRSTP